jgi:hypothetical protein
MYKYTFKDPEGNIRHVIKSECKMNYRPYAYTYLRERIDHSMSGSISYNEYIPQTIEEEVICDTF